MGVAAEKTYAATVLALSRHSTPDRIHNAQGRSESHFESNQPYDPALLPRRGATFNFWRRQRAQACLTRGRDACPLRPGPL